LPERERAAGFRDHSLACAENQASHEIGSETSMTRHVQLFQVAQLLFACALCAQSGIAEIPYDSTPNLLKMPEHIDMGEAVGVARNSKGNIFVYTRTGSSNAVLGGSRAFTHGGAGLFEFTRNGAFVREIGQGLYGFLFAHVVRVDPQDNIWVVDEGSSMIIKFSPEGRILMTMGRKPEAVPVPAREAGRGGAATGAGVAGDNFNRPTDVAWAAAGGIFLAGEVCTPRG